MRSPWAGRSSRVRPSRGVGVIEAHLVEIFDSVQGEGPHVGQPTLFVRLAECDLRCSWCDTPGSWRRVPTCRVYPDRCSQAFDEVPNPVTLGVFEAALARLGDRPLHWVSFTGGEPLLQPTVVADWAARARAAGFRTHLETHGLAVEGLEIALGSLDFVAMDWKLASDVRRVSDRGAGRVPDYHEVHAAFLAAIGDRAEACVKIVVSPNTERTEIEAAASCIARVRPQTPLILQPVTPTGGVKKALGPDALMAHLDACEELVRDVRIVPQTHKIYGAL